MAADADFIPQGCHVEQSADGTWVRLGFYNRAQTRPVIVGIEQLPALIAHLQAVTGTATVRPMNPGGLAAGTRFRLVGRDIRKLDSGGVRLTLHVKVIDGVRTVPMELSREDAFDLARKLTAR
jgi:hypothetical protein